MRNKRLFQLLLLMGVAFPGAHGVICQDEQVIQTNEKITINSTVLNETRSILVRLPANYAERSEKYPVIYMLDGQTPRITLMTGTIENLVDSDLAPEMILVSIPNTIRPRDMTPSVFAGTPASGGADNFIKFIESEVMPTVEKRYRVQPFKILVGHSLSGLLVSYAFVSRPELFNAYLAASPFLQWDERFVLKRGEALLKPKKLLNRTLYFAIGDEPPFVEAFNGFKEMLDRLQIKDLDYEVRQLPGENHWSTNADVFNRGLRKVWKSWRMPPAATNSELSLADLETHYKAASGRFGYTISIPENFLNPLGFRLIQSGKTAEAIGAFQRSTELYPNSPNALNGLASAFERNGEFAKAKENYEKALKLAEKGGSNRFTESIKESLKRVAAKITS